MREIITPLEYAHKFVILIQNCEQMGIDTFESKVEKLGFIYSQYFDNLESAEATEQINKLIMENIPI